MKLIKIILTLFVIVVQVKGCYKITGYKQEDLNTLPKEGCGTSPIPLMQTYNAKIISFKYGMIKYIIQGQEYNKPYLRYALSDCVREHCNLSIISFDMKYERIEMLIKFEPGCNVSEFETKLHDHQDCKYQDNNNISLRSRGNEEGENDFNFAYSLEQFKFLSEANFPTYIGNYVNPDYVLKAVTDYKSQEEKGNSNHKHNSSDEESRLKTTELQIFHYENYLVIVGSDKSNTFSLDDNHCVLRFVKYVKQLMSSCYKVKSKDSADAFTFFSSAPGAVDDHINPSKDIDTFQYGSINSINSREFTESIGPKFSIIKYSYVIFDEKIIEYGETRLSLRLENEDEKTVKKYYFIFTDNNINCIDSIKNAFYQHTGCTNDILFVRTIFKDTPVEIDINKYTINKYQLQLKPDGTLLKHPLSDLKLKYPETVRVESMSLKSHDKSEFLKLAVFRGKLIPDQHETRKDLYSLYRADQKCTRMVDNFLNLLKVKSDCEVLKIFQLQIIDSNNQLKGHNKKEQGPHKIFGEIRFEAEKVNIYFDKNQDIIKDLKEFVLQNKGLTGFHPTNSVQVIPLYYEVAKGVSDLIELTLPTNKILRLWIFKRDECIKNIMYELNKMVGCDNKGQFYSMKINPKSKEKLPVTLYFDFDYGILKDSSEPDEIKFNNLQINNNVISVGKGKPNYAIQLFQNPACNNQFQERIKPSLCGNVDTDFEYSAYDLEVNTQPNRFLSSYDISRISNIAKGSLKDLLGKSNYVVKLLTYKFNETEKEFYYLAQLYKVNGTSKIDILTIWFKFNTKCETLIHFFEARENGSMAINPIELYDPGLGGKAVSLIFDMNYPNVTEEDSKKSYVIIDLEIKPGDDNRMSEMDLYYLLDENDGISKQKETFKINTIYSPMIEKHISYLNTLLSGFNKDNEKNIKFIEKGMTGFGEIFLRTLTNGETYIKENYMGRELKYHPITLLREQDFEQIHPSIYKIYFSYVFYPNKVEKLHKTVYLNIKENQITDFVKAWNMILNCYEDTIVYENTIKGDVSQRLRGRISFSNMNGDKTVTIDEMSFPAKGSVSFKNNRYVYTEGGKDYWLMSGNKYCLTLIHQFLHMLETQCIPNTLSVITLSSKEDEQVELTSADHLTINLELVGKSINQQGIEVGVNNVKKPVLRVIHSYHPSNLVKKIVLNEFTLKLRKNKFIYADMLIIVYKNDAGKDSYLYFPTRAFQICPKGYQPFEDFTKVMAIESKERRLRLKNK
jgi:hypothetical protein